MEKKSSLWTLALAAALGFMPGAAEAQAPEIRVVSNAAMDALEAWSSPSHSYETIALDARPELIDEYVGVAEAYHGGRSLAEVFSSKLPATWLEIQSALGDDPAGAGATSSDLLAYAMAGGGADYRGWQNELGRSGAGFTGFIDRYHPEMAAELAHLNETPASRGVSLLDWARDNGAPELQRELRDLLGTVAKKKDCTCSTIVNYPHIPSSWESEVNESFSDAWGNLPRKRRDMWYTVYSKGAARGVNLWRRSVHNEWSVGREKATNMSSLRVRMLCTKNSSSSGEICTGPTCGGEFVARIGYSSRVYERHETEGMFNRHVETITADAAELTYDDPGPAPPVELFSKGVAVAGDVEQSWNAEAAANILFAALQIGLSAAGDGTTLAGTLTNELVTTTVTSGARLIERSGSTGDLSRDMMVAWDNSVGTPITLLPNQTHLFELKTSSRIYARGYGPRAENRNYLNSAFYIVGVGRNYSCAPNVTAPVARAHWDYARISDAPYSAPTLQNLVGTFAETELGTYPGNVASSPGQYP